jgi:glutaredoxin
MRSVTVYVGQGCHLCDAAVEAVQDVCGEEFVVVDITGDAELEAMYRERIPVVEVDGRALFSYFVHREALRAAIGA